MADDDKTEDPTPKRVEESREKGQLGKSQDLTAALMMAISVLFLMFTGPQMVKLHVDAARILLGNFEAIDVTEASFVPQCYDAMMFVFQGMAPFMLALFVAAIVSNVCQFGLLLTFKTITPDFDKINPLKGLKNKFSLKTVVTGLMNIAKTILFAWVSYAVLSSEWIKIFRLTGQDIMQNTSMLSYVFFKLAFYLILTMMILAIIDFAYQKWQNLQSMKMSKQEIKDEMKNYDGDPKIKQKRRQIQLQMSRQRMMKDVKDADVVITNPTHLSVAVKYDEATMRAPIVVAKGADLLALKIREIAKENNVPIVENKSLARSLYKTVEVGEPIPQTFFKAIAEMLAYVYNLKGRRTAKV
jgi:flagellar biosynthesis protein FlhB